MDEKRIVDGEPHRLADLIRMKDEKGPFTAAELGAILSHQLRAPLVFDLSAITQEQTVEQMTHVPDGEVSTFGGLLHHARPPINLLRLVKDFAKASRSSGGEGMLPPEVGTVLYYAAILVALMRCGERITELPDEALQRGIEWAAKQSWCDPQLRQLFEEGIKRLAPLP